jgi:iron complex transport system substrate-binding protein
MRIVSLIASATEIVHALGLGNQQVGRSHECDYPEQVKSLPVCTRPRFDISGSSREIDQRVKDTLRDAGSVYEVFDHILEQLQPTHILTQTQCRVCAVSLSDVEQALSDKYSTGPQVVALEPNSLADIFRDIDRVASACGIAQEGARLNSELRARIDTISAICRSQQRRPRVACIEWIEPLMAAGNWIPELVELAGAENLFGRSGSYSPWLDWNDVVAADSDAIVIMACGFDLARTAEEMHWLTEKPEWKRMRAVRDRRVFLTDANQFMTRPGPRIVESLQAFAEMLYPDAFEPKLRGIGWQTA